MIAVLPLARRALRRRGLAALVLGVLSLGSLPALAQDQEAAGPIVRLASPQTPPGGETFVTMILDHEPSVRLTQLKSELEFHTNQLTYVAARTGFAADLVDAKLDIKVEPVEAPAPDAAGAPATIGSRGPRARITISVTSKKPIPSGPVVEMRFRVAGGLEGTVLKVDQRTEVFGTDGARVENLTAAPGEVVVTSEAKGAVPMVFACFFYMH